MNTKLSSVILFFIFFNITLNEAQDIFGEFEQKIPGKAFIMCRGDSTSHKAVHFENDVVMAFYQPQFKKIVDTIQIDTVPINKSLYIKTKPESMKWNFRLCPDERWLPTKPEFCTNVLVVEDKASFYLPNKDQIPLTAIIEKQILVQAPKFEITDQKFETIQFADDEYVKVLENKEDGVLYFKFKAGYWYPWKEFIATGPIYNDCDPWPGKAVIKKVQIKLKELGYYHGSIDGIRNDQFVLAVVQYQRDHEMPARQFDINTLEKLKIY